MGQFVVFRSAKARFFRGAKDDTPEADPLPNSWVQLTTAFNELARRMGQRDFYPFVMSRPVLRKMHFIQMIVKEARGGSSLIDFT